MRFSEVFKHFLVATTLVKVLFGNVCKTLKVALESNTVIKHCLCSLHPARGVFLSSLLSFEAHKSPTKGGIGEDCNQES